MFFILLFLLNGCAEKAASSSLLQEETAETEAVSVENESVEKVEETHENSRSLNIKTYVLSKVDSLAVRSKANTSSEKLGSLDKGDMVSFCGEENGWYITYFRGRKAYVSAAEKFTEKTEMKRAENAVEEVIARGEKLLGTPYVYGAVRLHDGSGNLLKGFTANKFDCSSFMQYIFYYGADLVLGSTTRTQATQGAEVSRSELMRGDLIFMTNSSRKNNVGIERIGHVAMYLGDGYILHTASDHAVIEKMTDARWNNYITARRMIK